MQIIDHDAPSPVLIRRNGRGRGETGYIPFGHILSGGLGVLLIAGVVGCRSAEPAAVAAEPSPSADASSATAGEEGSTVIVSDENAELEPFREEINDLVAFDMMPVPAGSIAIQTEEGPKVVEVGPFWIGRTEVTWDEYDVYAYGTASEAVDEDAVIRPSRPYGAPDRGFGHRGYAALSMSYIAADEYARWLSVLTGKTYRLPTEAEWEYACRAGREVPYSPEELEERAWYWDTAFDKTHPVARLEPNEWGLHDMLGNAAEWCFNDEGEPLACGGSFLSKADDVGCSARMIPTPAWQETDPQIPKSLFWLTDAPFIGFRVIRVPDEEVK